jgi:acetyl esterase/lipase
MASNQDNDNDIANAIRGTEIFGLDIFAPTQKEADFPLPRAQHLLSLMHASIPPDGTEYTYGPLPTQHLRLWKPSSLPSYSPTTAPPPVVVFIHGGSWRVGTNVDSLGASKVPHLLKLGYAFVSVGYSLVPAVSVEGQVQEVADAVGYLLRNATELALDPDRMVLMGHSSGAHVACLLGTDGTYLERAGVSLGKVHGVVALDGSNYNCLAEVLDSPGPVAENMAFALGRDVERLRGMSPTYQARGENAKAFLLMHVQRQGDIRQAVEFAACLEAAGADAEVRVFEGQGFEGHVQLLLRLGEADYPATAVMDAWLKRFVPLVMGRDLGGGAGLQREHIGM